MNIAIRGVQSALDFTYNVIGRIFAVCGMYFVLEGCNFVSAVRKLITKHPQN